VFFLLLVSTIVTNVVVKCH